MDTSCLPRTVDPGECRCCGISRKCRIINKAYDFKGNSEVYWNMMMETYDILLPHVNDDIKDRLICATCVVRLREAYNFKKQVKLCDQNFQRVYKERCKILKYPKSIDYPGVKGNRISNAQNDHKAANMDNIDNEDDAYLVVKMDPEKTDPLESKVKRRKIEESAPVDQESKSNSLLELLLLGKEDVGKNTDSKLLNEDKRNCPSDSDAEPEYLDSIESVEATEEDLDPEPFSLETNVKNNSIKERALSRVRGKTKKNEMQEKITNSSLLEKLLVGEHKKSGKIKNKTVKNKPDLEELRINKARAAPSSRRPHSKRRMRHATLTDRLSYDNLINIVNHTHVCPFKNITANYYCFYCRDNFTDPHGLRQHTSTHDPKHFESYLKAKYMTKLDITRLDCRICDATCNTLDDLKLHLRSHSIEIHEAPDMFVKFRLTHPKVDCLECGETFLFIDKLMEHLPVHFGKHVCDQCGAAFIQSSSLESHIRAHRVKGKGFPCRICGRVLCSVRVRKVHETRVHAKKPVIDCMKCDEKFTTYNQRNKHLVAVHGDNRTIPCPYCEKEFENRNAFRSHNVTVHLREENFQCAICFQKFMLSKQLSKHKKRCHSEIEAVVM